MTMEHRRHLAALAETLHGERRLLERLLFKLVEARLVLAADEARFLPFAMAEVEEVVERVRFGESYRRRAVKELAEAIEEDEERITLSFLASWAPDPYRTMFAEHRDQFMRLTTEIEQASVDNRRLANLAVQNLGDTLVALLGARDAGVYTSIGIRGSDGTTGPTQLDQVL